MALTTGKRQVTTTASSVANRMGVVPAYAGDPVSTIAKVATEKLDFFAKRQASLEEAKYKADLEIKTSKFINAKAREHFNDPKTFTTSTDSYIESLVNEAPTRYKSWTKSMISGKAIRKGETIFANRIKQDHNDAMKLQEERVRTHNEETLEDLFDLATVSQGDPELKKDSTFTNNIDDYHKNVWLPKVSEMYKSHLEVYNAAYPEDRNNMLTPQEFLRTMQISFEQLRLNTKVKNIIDTTMLEITEMGGDYQIGNDKIKELNLKIGKMLNEEYMKSPQIDMFDGKATLVNTTKDERGQIISNAESFMKGHLNVYSNQLVKYESEKKLAIADQLNNDLYNFVNNPDDFGIITEKQLERKMIDLELDDNEKLNYRNSYFAGQMIKGSIDENLQNFVGDTSGMKMDTFSGRLFVSLERKGYLEALGVNNQEDLKKIIIQQHMKRIFPSLRTIETDNGPQKIIVPGVDNIADTWLGTESVFVEDSEGNTVLDKDQNALATAKFNKMVGYAKMMGEPIPQLTDFFNDIMNINIKSESDLMKLDNAAYMVNYFMDTDGFEFMFKGIDSDVKANILKLQEYHKLRHADFDRLTRVDVAQSFFESLKPKESTRTGKIKIAMDNFINYGEEGDDSADQIDLTAKVDEYIKKYQDNRVAFSVPLNLAQPVFTSLATGEMTPILGDSVIDSMTVDANKVRKAIRPYLDIYLTNMFEDESYVTKQSIEKNLNKAMKFIMEDFANDGFNWKVFSGSSYNE
tara:strand:- start:4390 stop:6633 length:2244 start_codon:yes stop_codon:yes gene_type:complete